MHRATALPLFVALLFTLVAPLARAQQHIHDDAHGFTMDLPKGWTVADPSILEEANKAAAMSAKKHRFNYFAAFMREADGNNPGGLVLMQFTDYTLPAVSKEQFEREIKSMTPAALSEQVKKEAGANISQVGFDMISADTTRYRVLMTATLVEEGTPARALMVMYPGKKGMVQFNCYAAPESFEQIRGEFMQVADSFAYDPGHEWTPGTAGSSGYRRTGGAVAIGCGVIALLFGLVRRMAK